jgi:mono/diheme cytochrome c family protein
MGLTRLSRAAVIAAVALGSASAATAQSSASAPSSATAAGAAAPASAAKAPKTSAGKSIERGRYLTTIAGCNDCHTAGFAPSGGTTPERDWLKGDQLGWKGPWGTTYPANLRLVLNAMTEDQWVKVAKTTRYRPPMPWFNLHAMTEADLRDIHRFVRFLGAAGEPAPAFVPPGREPAGPAITFPAPPK